MGLRTGRRRTRLPRAGCARRPGQHACTLSPYRIRLSLFRRREEHRIRFRHTAVHAGNTAASEGTGKRLDRFSAPRVDGGPKDSEYFAVARPVLPGAALREFSPRTM